MGYVVLGLLLGLISLGALGAVVGWVLEKSGHAPWTRSDDPPASDLDPFKAGSREVPFEAGSREPSAGFLIGLVTTIAQLIGAFLLISVLIALAGVLIAMGPVGWIIGLMLLSGSATNREQKTEARDSYETYIREAAAQEQQQQRVEELRANLRDISRVSGETAQILKAYAAQHSASDTFPEEWTQGWK